MTRKRILLAVLILVIAGIAVIGASIALVEDRAPTQVASVGFESVMRAQLSPQFRRARENYEFEFPRDHGPHPEYASEWWYLTGNVQNLEGHRFGYQVTLFRSTITTDEIRLDSDLATSQYYMAHFAITDVEGKKFYAQERFSRGAAGLAGATADPFRAWLENWRITGNRSDACEGCMDLNLGFATDEFELMLNLKPVRPLVFQGDNGFSAKTVDGENASHYYSMTRMASTGFVRVGDKRAEVQGASWFDREWSTSALGADQVGWDWFSLHLDDESDLMIYQMRRSDGSVDPASAGILVTDSGQSDVLGADDFKLGARKSWTSRTTGAEYPLRWTLALPQYELELQVEPVIDDQEHRGVFRYWEGAVRVSGKRGDKPIKGVGYMELTGYTSPLSPP